MGPTQNDCVLIKRGNLDTGHIWRKDDVKTQAEGHPRPNQRTSRTARSAGRSLEQILPSCLQRGQSPVNTQTSDCCETISSAFKPFIFWYFLLATLGT